MAGAATSTIFLATKNCHNKSILAMTKRLSQQNCCNKTFVATNTCLSWQAYFCRDKRVVHSDYWLPLVYQHTYPHDSLPCSITGGSCHKYNFCCDKSFVVTNVCLPWQNFRHNKIMFVVTKRLLRQTHICRDKHTFVGTKDVLCCDKHVSGATKVSLSWQNFCRDKIMFVTRKVLLRQAYFCCNKRCVLSRQTRVCCNKAFVATKMILVAAPANDNIQLCHS